MTPLKLVIIAGARPNFMKVAPIIKEIERMNVEAGTGQRQLEYVLVHTGQHYDEKMSEVFFRELGIPKPHSNLEVGSGSHAVQTAAIMTSFEPVILAHRPDWLVVVGDVNSTMACALVASKLGVRIAHVEAGLRSNDRAMPEEINRLVTDSISDLLLTPSPDANVNLVREGVPDWRIRFVGNVMIDALVSNLPLARQSQILKQLGVSPKNYVFVTLHRPSNVDNPNNLRQIMLKLGKVAERVPVVFSMHPRTRKMLTESGTDTASLRGLTICEPVGYHDSLHLTENARFVLTDSGGLQEESTYFKTPCLTLRPNTERPVTISEGSNKLTSLEQLDEDLEEVLKGPLLKGRVPENWDGQTAGRIIAAIMEHR